MIKSGVFAYRYPRALEGGGWGLPYIFLSPPIEILSLLSALFFKNLSLQYTL